MSYQATEITQVALEPILQRQGWKPPKVSLLLVKAAAERIPEIPWVKKYQLPKDFVIFPWQELTEEDRQQLQQGQEEKPWYQQGLSPFLDEASAKSASISGSLIVRKFNWLRLDKQAIGGNNTGRFVPYKNKP